MLQNFRRYDRAQLIPFPTNWYSRVSPEIPQGLLLLYPSNRLFSFSFLNFEVDFSKLIVTPGHLQAPGSLHGPNGPRNSHFITRYCSLEIVIEMRKIFNCVVFLRIHSKCILHPFTKKMRAFIEIVNKRSSRFHADRYP